jgi:hypothetical protein
MTFDSKTFAAKFPSECKCGKKWGKNTEVGFHKLEGKDDWVCSDPNCPLKGKTVPVEEPKSNNQYNRHFLRRVCLMMQSMPSLSMLRLQRVLGIRLSYGI